MYLSERCWHTARARDSLYSQWTGATNGLRLPRPLQADTGIVLASAFVGHTNFADHIARDGDDGTVVNERFLFQTLAMGHSNAH